MSEMYIRVESIFDVALGKLLLDKENIRLVNPNDQEQKLLNVDEETHPHDVHIGDLDRRVGILVKGLPEAVQYVEDVFKNNLTDSIIFRHAIQQDAIYLGVVSKYIYRKQMAILDLGENLKGVLFNVNARIGDKIIVQIKELTNEKGKLPICSTTITLSGKYIILEVGSSFVRVSRKIKGEQRKKLHDLGMELVPEGFGIIVRTSASAVSREDLEFEISQQLNLWKRILEDRQTLFEPKKLVDGEMQTEIILNYQSKRYLDRIRDELEATIDNYYNFKAYSLASGFALDFIQKFMDKLDKKEISSQLYNMIVERDFPINNHIKAEFYHLDGTHDEIILGDIIQNKDLIITRKVFDLPPHDKSPIFNYDLGDSVTTIFKPGSWTIHYKYYRGISDALIGERLKIITPLDIVFRGRIRTFDLGMNLYRNATDNSVKSIVDNFKLDSNGHGLITDKLDKKLGEVLTKAMDLLNKNEEYILIDL